MKRIIIIAALLLVAAGAGAQERTIEELGTGIVKRVDRWQLDNGVWEKYRDGLYGNLMLSTVLADGQRAYVLSRMKTELHRHHEGAAGNVPIMAYHYHHYYSGCVIDESLMERLTALENGQSLTISSRQILHDHDSEGHAEFLYSVATMKESPTEGFYLLVERTKRKRRDVIRIIDSEDRGMFDRMYWELPYKKFIKLIGEGYFPYPETK